MVEGIGFITVGAIFFLAGAGGWMALRPGGLERTALPGLAFGAAATLTWVAAALLGLHEYLLGGVAGAASLVAVASWLASRRPAGGVVRPDDAEVLKAELRRILQVQKVEHAHKIARRALRHEGV